ncbi:MAG TPA: hypothetical protein VME42_21000 [Steroidobacteraceae bacterium]|nr:hypothetical protein [Steroidobacteraceae bacterium]
MKKFATVLVIALLGVMVWVLVQSSNIAIIVNGRRLAGPAGLAVEGWGMLVAIVSLFCTAILLVFLFAGAGLIILAALVVIGFVAALFAFPFMLPLLIPLFLVWAFVAAVHGSAKRGR